MPKIPSVEKEKKEPLRVTISAPFRQSEADEIEKQTGGKGRAAFVRDAVLKKLKRSGFVPAK